MTHTPWLRWTMYAAVAGLFAGLTGCEGGGGGGGGNDAADLRDSVPTTWAPGQSIGPINLGDSYATVVQKIGAPDEIRYTPDDDGDEPGSMWTDYNTLGLSMAYNDNDGDQQLGDHETVDDIFSYSMWGIVPPAYAYQGITFGSTVAEAEAVLGQGDDFPSDDGAFHNIWWYNRGVTLMFTDDALDWIFVYEPIGHALSDQDLKRKLQRRVEEFRRAQAARAP